MGIKATDNHSDGKDTHGAWKGVWSFPRGTPFAAHPRINCELLIDIKILFLAS